MKLKRGEYLQVVGLLALAPQHNQALNDIRRAICEIVKVEKYEDCGHVGDAVYCEYSADELLRKLDVVYGKKAKRK